MIPWHSPTNIYNKDIDGNVKCQAQWLREGGLRELLIYVIYVGLGGLIPLTVWWNLRCTH